MESPISRGVDISALNKINVWSVNAVEDSLDLMQPSDHRIDNTIFHRIGTSSLCGKHSFFDF